MPALTFARFMDNHGMLQLKGRPRWRTISGGSASYVAALRAAMSAQVRLGACVHKVARATDSVTLLSDAGPESYDAVVLAVHSDQALALLGDPSRDEREILGAIRYRPNVATLHTDTSLLPRRRRAWAAWNAYLPQTSRAGPTLTYWMNCLQRLETRTQFCVTLNLEDQIAPGSVLGRWTCHHPVFDTGAVAAQARGASIQGQRRTWYCGAYWGYGFHEDAVASAARVCDQLNGVVG
jgi:predicted NAD/FAD-binding protein